MPRSGNNLLESKIEEKKRKDYVETTKTDISNLFSELEKASQETKKINKKDKNKLDEFTGLFKNLSHQEDDEQKEEGKGHGRAHSLKGVYTPIKTQNAIYSFYLSNISIGTHTFKHQSGYNNFVQRNKPLGWLLGSDSRETNLGMNALYKRSLIANIEFGQREIGEKNIIKFPYGGYMDYQDGPFPSGDVEKIYFVSGRLQWWWKRNLSLITEFEYNDSNRINREFQFNIGVDIFYPFNKKI